MKTAIGCLATALGLIVGLAPASADPVEEAIARFLGPEWERLDAAAIGSELDGEAGPLEAALLLLDAGEPGPDRLRYRLSLARIMAEDGTGAAVPVDLVEIARFNLGPAIRVDLIEALGAENVADEAAFGTGPHIAWRVVSTPLMGANAVPLEIGRREIADAEAFELDCLGRGCLDIFALAEDVREWEEIDPGAPGFSAGFAEVTAEGIAAPARILAEMALVHGLANAEDGRYFWTGPEMPEAVRGDEPFIFSVIEVDLGQDTGTEALLVNTLLNDHMIRDYWVRRAEFPGAVFWFEDVEGWDGP